MRNEAGQSPQFYSSATTAHSVDRSELRAPLRMTGASVNWARLSVMERSRILRSLNRRIGGVVGDEFLATFTPNGQTRTLTDGEANRTTYIHDGHDRLHQTRYPHKSTKNYSDPGDYEQLTSPTMPQAM